MLYDHKQYELLPTTHVKPMLAKVNIHTCLPENVRALRFNQQVIANNFGTFADFVYENAEALDSKRNKELIDMIKKKQESLMSTDQN